MKKILNNYEREERNRHYRGYMLEYKRCQETMERASRQGKQHCSFGVLLNHEYFPDWNYIKVINIIIDKLREEGITVRLMKPNILLINWKKFEYNTKEDVEEKKKYLKEIENTEKFIKEKEEKDSSSDSD